MCSPDHSVIADAGSGGHLPVMLDEVLEALDVRPDGDYLDGTFGGGGYSRAILDVPPHRLIGLDRDPQAVARGRRLAETSERFTMLDGRFGDMAEHLAEIAIDQLDGIVLDIGVSSQQIDDPARGFSFAADGPLDMRMEADGETAADVVNGADETTLASIIYRYGEERASRRIAKAIVERRGQAPITRTAELADIVAGVLGRREKIDPATRTFQALRIYVNDELGELERALAAAEAAAAPGRPPGGGGLPLPGRPDRQAIPDREERAQGEPVAPSARDDRRRRAGRDLPAALETPAHPV